MGIVGPILAFSALLTFLLSFGATAIHGVVTGRHYYEPNCPPVVFRERPVKFFALLAFDFMVVGFLVVGCVKVGGFLF
jgi:hypothetical protein